MALSITADNAKGILEMSKEESNEYRTRKLMHHLPEVMIDRILIYLSKSTKHIKLIWNHALINSTFFTQFFGLKQLQKEPIKLHLNDKLQENIQPILNSKQMASHICHLGLEIIFRDENDTSDIEDDQCLKLQQLSPLMERLQKLEWLKISNLRFDVQNVLNEIKRILINLFGLRTVLLQTNSSYNEEKVSSITQGCKAMQYSQIQKSSIKGPRKRKLDEQETNSSLREGPRKGKLVESGIQASLMDESLDMKTLLTDSCSNYAANTGAIEAIPYEVTKEIETCFGSKMMAIVHQCENNQRTQTNGHMKYAWSIFKHQRFKSPPAAKIVTKINIVESSMKDVKHLIEKFAHENSDDSNVEQVILIKQI